ncbi:hypothetical protein AB0A69_01575 [Streptomyces sp. NPDC045431]|uniref:hypothetical protein n=1 Tax=Streptomyces sp. NPDC045431 TaxID=3155613 RepID=UPI0033E47E31
MYRLLPALGEFRTLLFDTGLGTVMRWQRTGDPAHFPSELRGKWIGDPALRVTDFPSDYPGAPVLSRRITDALHGDLTAAGRFVPVRTDDPEAGEFLLYAVEAVVDCLDTRRSSKAKKTTGDIKKAVFRPDAVAYGLPAFRIPEAPKVVYWNGWAVDRLRELLSDDLEARLVWSEDPGLTPHRDPMGF